ncbi:ABC transporter substrate-binding protein [Paenibacillus sp. GCM10027627]|uniref:ABC transporter substrate-binding protein n=1 Tax=unclassified Paenibacillus TaxID=185978 RepID=UPI003637AD45
MKSFRWINIIMMAALLVGGCSIGGTKQKEIQLKVLTLYNSQFPGYQSYLEHKFPGTTFEFVKIDDILRKENVAPDNRNERIAQIIDEQDADLYFGFDPDNYMDSAVTVDLAQLIARDRLPLNDIQQQMVDWGTDSDGKVNGLSPTFTRETLYINKKLFNEAGLPEPQSPMTWEQFREAAKQLKEKEPSAIGYEMEASAYWPFLLPWLGDYILGASRVDHDKKLTLAGPEWRQMAQEVVEDIKEKRMRADGYNPDYKERLHTGMFVSNSNYVYSLLSGNQSAQSWIIAGLPKAASNLRSTPFLPTASFYMDNKSKYTEQMWEMIAYLMSEEAAADISTLSVAGGFVTYPQHVKIGLFQLDAVFQVEGDVPANDAYRLTNEAQTKLDSILMSQFTAMTTGLSDFDKGWASLEQAVQDINDDPSNFIP